MGALNNLIPFSLIFWGQTHIASGLASILNATTPLWTVLLAHFLTRDEKLTASRISRGAGRPVWAWPSMIGPAAFGGFGLDALAQLASWQRPSPMRWPASSAAASRPWAYLPW